MEDSRNCSMRIAIASLVGEQHSPLCHQFLLDILYHQQIVTSEKMWQNGTSITKIRNKIGPRMLPCGMLDLTGSFA